LIILRQKILKFAAATGENWRILTIKRNVTQAIENTSSQRPGDVRRAVHRSRDRLGPPVRVGDVVQLAWFYSAAGWKLLRR
jgi:hypothetical protein